METGKTIGTSDQDPAFHWDKVADALEDCIFLLDSDFIIVKTNRAMRAFLGKTDDEIIGKHCWELIHGTTQPVEFCPITKMMGSKKRESAVIEFAGRYVRITLDPILDEEGSVKGAIHIIRDIDESERKNALVRESEKKYHELVDTMSDVVFTLDFDGAIVQTSPTMKRIVGWSTEEVIGKHFSDFVHPDDLKRAEEEFVRAIQGIGRPIEIRLMTLSGAPRWVRINALLIMKNDEPENLLCVLSDIHDKKIAEEALKEREERVRKLVTWVPGMIYQFKRKPDGTYCVPFATDHIKDIFGCTPEDVRDDFSPIVKVILPEDLDKVISTIEYSAEHLTVWSCEYRVQIPGRPIRWMSGHSTPERLIDGSVIWYGFNYDITELKEMREALVKNQELLHDVEKMSKIGGWEFDVKTMTQTWTEETFRILEIDMADGEPKVPEGVQFITPEYRTMADAALKRAIEYGEPFDQEWEVITAKGNRRWVRSIAKTNEENGKITSVSGSFQDITDQKRADAALRESEKKYRLLVDSAAEVILVAQDGMLRLVNPKAVTITGFSEQELMSRPFASFIHPDDRAFVVENYKKRLTGDAFPDRYDFRLIAKDGSIIWVEISAVLIEWEGRPATLNFLTDITIRRQAEERLRESEGELREANKILREERDRAQHYLNDVRAIIVNLDSSGKVTLINKKGCEILGRTESEIIGMNWFEKFLPKKVRGEVRNVFDEIIAGRIENVENYDNPILTSDGRIRTISWHNALIRDESGRIAGTLSVGEDLTDRLQIETDLKVATENLTRTNTSLIDAKLRSQTYFDFLAHDIANILAPIMSYAELMSKKEQYPPDVVSYNKKIVDQAKRATSLIHNLRKLEMLEEKNVPDMNVVDIKRIFSFVENSIRHKYPEKKTIFTYHLPEDIPIKSRGGEYIDFVIRHVFDNAVRHAQSDTVNIDVTIDEEGENEGGKFWRIAVEDDGPGISERMKKEITKPLDPEKRYNRGVVSSLGFCSAAIIGIGGELKIENRVPDDQSKGTRVVVWIPVYD